MELNSGVLRLISDWFRRVRESQRAHYECGTRFMRFNYLLGIPTIVLSAAVGTTVFAYLDKQATGELKIALGLVSVLAAVLSGLQTFLSFAERANRHRITGAKYGAIRRRLETLKTLPPEDEQALRRELESIKQAMDELAENAPHVPSNLKSRVDRELKSRDHRRIFDLPGDTASMRNSSEQ